MEFPDLGRSMRKTAAAIAAFSLLLASCTADEKKLLPANIEQPDAAVVRAESLVPENPMKDAYFGDTHVHTSYSLDAYIGGTRLTPDQAYRFAKGEAETVNGKLHRIGRPLDFVAVTDHAEFLGEMYSAQVEGAPGHDHPALAELRGLTEPDKQLAWFVEYVMKNVRSGKTMHPPFYAGEATTKSAWELNNNAARAHYIPGKFTTFSGFEWSAAPKAANLHRNILFRDMNLPDLPFSSIDSGDVEKLWAWIDELNEAKGIRAFAIPHNSNASKGLMFAATTQSGAPIDAAYARTRARLEPLIEMMQVKGNSEVTRKFWAADEFADFENADSMEQFGGRLQARENYVRWGITKGLDYRTKLGENPFSYGFIGGTDTHNGTPGDTDENRFIGGHGGIDGNAISRRTGIVEGWMTARDSNPGSLAGVWATKNTRDAIWDAMAARETFVTSGTRIKLRLFGGANVTAPASPTKMIEQGYRQGVPMGGTLSGDDRPKFNVWAMKDPNGANLDRIQIIKGWVDTNGEPQEHIYNIVWSGDRKLDADGKLPSVGNTVDIARARYRNNIGLPMLMGHWTDPDFVPGQYALYYIRVLEIPTPRWTTYDAVRNNLPLLKDVPATIQERAWSSPIWYSPKG